MQAAVGEEEGRAEQEAQLYYEAEGRFGMQTAKLWAREEADGLSYEAMLGLGRRVQAPFAQAAAVEGAIVAIARPSAPIAAAAEAQLSLGWAWDNGLYAVAAAGARGEAAGFSPRWQATLGRNGPRSLVFVQAHHEAGPPTRDFTRAEAAAVWFGQRPWGLQLGVRVGLGHEETAFTIGLWRRAGRG